MVAQKVLRVGIIGCGEVAQVIHLPTLHLLNHLYTVIAICDISQKTLDICQARYGISNAKTSPEYIFQDPDVDVVFNLTSDAFHEEYAIQALKAGKHVFQEKPLTLSLASAKRIVEAERRAENGARLFVGYMRRYAPTFVNAFKREVGSIDRILYARCRGIIGPNAYFVNQSGTSPFKDVDEIPPQAKRTNDQLLSKLLAEAFADKVITKERMDFCRFLGTLGSHDLSLMRETLGMPDSVAGVSANEPFYSAILNYDRDDHRFSVTYESGIDAVARFDSHLTVYGEKKTVSIQYDTPFIKGLPIKVRVDEINEHGEMVTKEILSSYEDAYTAEMKEMHACLTEGLKIKTSAEDATKDLELFKMLFDQYEKQGLRS